ncbi:MAG: UDP-N-acetylmuramoyl-L-alanine--D-glutamate ligase [Deltaproteobacteria bacterium]
MIAKKSKDIKTLFEAKGGGISRAREALSGVSALVVGIASTGVSCARFLRKCGADVVATDSRPAEEIPEVDGLKALGVKITAGGHEGVDLNPTGLVIVSPGVPYNIPLLAAARQAGAHVISDIELAYLFIDSPIVAIAGTNGKTTTTTLIGEMLKDAGIRAFVGGNIGRPVIEFVESDAGAAVVVLEISSFHLETTRTFNPHIAVLLNITEDHLDRYDSFEHYAETKFRLFENHTRSDYAIVNVNDPLIAGRIREKGIGNGSLVPFTVAGGLAEGLSLKGDAILYRRGKEMAEVYPAAGFGLRGLHNMENIMASIAAARISGVGQESILRTLKGFKGLGHRMELVREIDGVEYVDDSKATNIGAVMMALKGIAGPVILIAGGKDKGGDYRVMNELIRKKVRLLILLGEARPKIRDAFSGLTDIVMVNTLKDAVRVAGSKAKPGDTVLLSPACSSFDMFKSYKDRGEKFRQEVNSL